MSLSHIKIELAHTVSLSLSLCLSPACNESPSVHAEDFSVHAVMSFMSRCMFLKQNRQDIFSSTQGLIYLSLMLSNAHIDPW